MKLKEVVESHFPGCTVTRERSADRWGWRVEKGGKTAFISDAVVKSHPEMLDTAASLL